MQDVSLFATEASQPQRLEEFVSQQTLNLKVRRTTHALEAKAHRMA
jgi:hypothetical protein